MSQAAKVDLMQHGFPLITQWARMRAAKQERSSLGFSVGRLTPRPSCACSLEEHWSHHEMPYVR
jgi:hypothetical protein